MTIYQSDPNMLPDSEFHPGSLEFLVAGNECRLLDGRRTPGFIEEIFHDSAMFRWRITDFEHKGKYWDLPAEWAERAQFAKESETLDQSQAQALQAKIEELDQELIIEPDPQSAKSTAKEISVTKAEAQEWLRENSQFFQKKETLDFSKRTGSNSLAQDLVSYLSSHSLSELEERTAEIYVLNPYSGEWIKGMEIVLAEMGLIPYRAKQPRTPDIFSGIGSKEARRSYLVHRLAFIRAYFHLLNIDEVVLYRGMKTESSLMRLERRLISTTFDLEVARALSDFERNPRFRNSYLAKMVVPVERLWMTYLETEPMNREYKEAEAVIFASASDPMLW